MLDGPPLECHILDTGYCLASEHYLMRGGRHREVHCHSIAALLRHPKHGWFLWDAGYAPRLLRATDRFPFRLYRWVTPMRLRPELAVAAQLAHFGLQPRDIRRVILSHFHADHVAGLRDFPLAEIITTRAAFEDVAWRSGFRALLRAFVPALLPDDFERRAQLLPPFAGPALGGFGPVHDPFGDSSALLVSLPGHARGQIGLLVRTAQGPLFFVADSCWLSEAVRRNAPPHPITHLFIDSASDMRRTLAHLHQLAREQPGLALVPSHCPEAFALRVGGP
jgi:glyoxylase-like metal-dependent hydrolase (beta-lactamase superfamily II)